jgi:putative ABC transport system permease protein
VRRWCLSADRLVAAAICEKAKESNLTEALRQCGPLLREFHSSATSISARLPFCVGRLFRRSNSAPSFEPCRSSIDWLRDLLLAEQRSFGSRARAARRRREMAVRSALGASRGRIARQMLVESLLLSIASGSFGLAGAYALIRLILAAAPGDVPQLDDVHLDVRVLIFTLAIVLLDGVLFGVLPAWQSSKADPHDAMRSDSRSSTANPEGTRLRRILISVEVGICTLCLIIGALLLQSFARVLTVQRGFDVDDILTVDVGLPNTRYPGAKRAAFLRSTIERLEALPGITTVGVSNLLPLSGGDGPGMPLIVDGSPPAPTLERPTARIRMVNANYFRTMSIPVRAGRVFQDDDLSRRVAVVSGVTANRLWPTERALGKQFHLISEDSPSFEVVGIVGDARSASLTSDPSLTIYLPYWQPNMNFVSRFSFAMKTTDVAGTTRLVRTVLREQDPELPKRTAL